MKYLVVTTPDDVIPGDVRTALEELIPGVKVVVIAGANSATLVEVETPDERLAAEATARATRMRRP